MKKGSMLIKSHTLISISDSVSLSCEVNASALFGEHGLGQ